jgi:DNA-binding response OmpR family regulator
MKKRTEGKNKKIVVGEDDKNYSNIFKLKLQKEGYEVFLAENGGDVIDIARRENPKLILLDIIMPIQNGFETLKILKSDPQLLHIPIVMVSNLGQEEDIKKAKKIGATDYFVKANISIQEMINIVRRYME